MLLYQRFVPGLAVNSYVIGDEKSGEAAVIDPSRDIDEFLAYAKSNNLRIRKTDWRNLIRVSPFMWSVARAIEHRLPLLTCNVADLRMSRMWREE